MKVTPNQQRGQPSPTELRDCGAQVQWLSASAMENQAEKGHHRTQQRSQGSTDGGLRGLFSPHHESVGLPLPHTEKLPHKRKRRKSEILTDYPKGIITHICQIGLNLGGFLSLWYRVSKMAPNGPYLLVFMPLYNPLSLSRV